MDLSTISALSEWSLKGYLEPREQERSVNQGSEERKSLSHLAPSNFPIGGGTKAEKKRPGIEINARETLVKRPWSQVGDARYCETKLVVTEREKKVDEKKKKERQK